MSSLPLTATKAEIEEEIDFVGIRIDTLDPGADDYQDALAELQAEQRELESRLLQQLPQTQPGSGGLGDRTMNVNSSDPSRWWETAFSDSRDVARNTSDDSSSATLSSQDHALPRGHKRPRPTSHSLIDEFASKRQTPDRVFGVLSDADDASSVDSRQRAMRRHEAAETHWRSRQEILEQDAALARQMSQAPDVGPSASSSQARTQTTLGPDGGYRRLPSFKSEFGSKPLSFHSSQPQQNDSNRSLPGNMTPDLSKFRLESQYNDRTRTLPWHQQTPPNPLPQQPSRPHTNLDAVTFTSMPTTNFTPRMPSHRNSSLLRNPSAVVDLTGSDSDELEVIGSRSINSGYGMPGPSRRLPTQAGYHIPGAYPVDSPVYPQGYQGSNFSSPQPLYLRSSIPATSSKLHRSSTAYQGTGNELDEMSYLLGGGNSMGFNSYQYGGSGAGAFGYGDSDPYATHHSSQGGDAYAGHGALWTQRYNALANYDSTKTKDELEALLKNIRPDEDMPAHLRVKTPDSMTIELHKYQELGLTWLQKCEDGSNKGGILADDMGLGKTIQMLSLMVTRRSQDPRCKTTLIVAPVALMRQWKQEIQQKIKPGLNHALTVYVHHGPSKKKDFRDLQMFDVVLTTFGSLAVEVKKLENIELQRRANPDAPVKKTDKCVLIGDDARWYRVILDEAQCIKNKSTQTSKGACMVKAKYRWCMSGTPMMNSVEELYSLIRFLRIKPYNQWEKFRMDFKLPLSGRDMEERQTAMRRLQTLCKAIMLRRTKKSTFEGKPILVLPERTTEVDSLEFDEHERDFYQALETQSRLAFNKYLRRGTIGKKYTAILVLLLRLRQACCHPHLVKDFGVSAAADMTEDELLSMAHELSEPVVARIKATNGNFECPVCYDVTSNPAIFIPCGHDACSECFAKLTDPAEAIQNGEEGSTRFKCPNCRGPIDPKRLTDFTSFKKVHAPEMLTEEEARALQAEDDDEADESDEEEAETDDEDDEDEAGAADLKVETTVKAEVDDDPDDLDAGVNALAQNAASVKQENEGEWVAGSSKLTLTKGKSKLKERSTKSKKGKGKTKEEKEEKRGKKAKPKMTMAELKKRSNRNMTMRKEYLRMVRKDYVSSAKIDRTMQLVEEIMNGELKEKILIFSQWTSLLDLLEVPIDDAGYGYRRYDGSMNAGMRGDAVDDFRDERQDVRIMLVSLKAGNAGLNLNMASQVIILDPFWNPYIEEQAIDRAHRIGQKLPVKVHRVLIENTVEDRILGIQERKRELISEALDEKASQNLSRLGVRELAYLFGITSNPNQNVDYAPRRD